MRNEHNLIIGQDFIDGTWCAECSCGWESDERNAEADAIEDWENHSARGRRFLHDAVLHEAGMSDELRQLLIPALKPWVTFLAEDGHSSLRAKTAEELTDAALDAIPDGWAKIDGEWIRITSDGVGYGEFDRETT